MLVGEGLVVAITVEESVVLLPPAAAALMGEEQTTLVTAAPQATLEHQAGASSSNDNVLMVLVNQGASLPSPTRDREEAAAVAPETPAAVVVSSIGGTEDLLMSRYLTIPGNRVIDLDATELLSNDREILEAVTEWVFADSSILEPKVPDVAVSVAATSVACVESTPIAPLLKTIGTTVYAPLLQTAEVAVVAPPPSTVRAVEEVTGAAETSSAQPAVAVEKGASTLHQPTMVPQERDARQEPPRRRFRRPWRAWVRSYREMLEVVMARSSISPASHGRRPLRSETMSRMTRRSRRVTPSSVAWCGCVKRSTS
jgi:hypothetical protein